MTTGPAVGQMGHARQAHVLRRCPATRCACSIPPPSGTRWKRTSSPCDARDVSTNAPSGESAASSISSMPAPTVRLAASRSCRRRRRPSSSWSRPACRRRAGKTTIRTPSCGRTEDPRRAAHVASSSCDRGAARAARRDAAVEQVPEARGTGRARRRAACRRRRSPPRARCPLPSSSDRLGARRRGAPQPRARRAPASPPRRIVRRAPHPRRSSRSMPSHTAIASARRGHAELLVDRADVVLDRLLADHELLRRCRGWSARGR